MDISISAPDFQYCIKIFKSNVQFSNIFAFVVYSFFPENYSAVTVFAIPVLIGFIDFLTEPWVFHLWLKPLVFHIASVFSVMPETI